MKVLSNNIHGDSSHNVYKDKPHKCYQALQLTKENLEKNQQRRIGKIDSLGGISLLRKSRIREIKTLVNTIEITAKNLQGTLVGD